MHLNKLKKNYGSTGKINTNSIGGLDLAEVERGIIDHCFIGHVTDSYICFRVYQGNIS